MLETQPNALLILVPRHPERFDDVFALCQQQGFASVRRTTTPEVTDTTQVFLGDTMGEMLILMGAADVCFMGGSLIGDKVGGHNVLEPLALGLPVINGPSYFNFKEIVEEFKSLNKIHIINDNSDLAQQVSYLFKHTQIDNNVILNNNALQHTMTHIGNI